MPDTSSSSLYDRLATLDVTLLPPDTPETVGIQRVRLDESHFLDERDPVEFTIGPLSHSRVEIAVGDSVISIGYTPPAVNPDTPQWEQVSPIAYRKLGTT